MIRAGLAAMALSAAMLPAQSKSAGSGPHRMEVTLQRQEKGAWRTIDPALILEHDDVVRFRFRTNFDGYLYVMNMGSSGNYEQLFPHSDTGSNNRVLSGKDYMVPATEAVFRVGGPAGYDTVYWLVSPAPLSSGGPVPRPPARTMAPPETSVAPSIGKTDLIPRCDDTILRARGDCVDSSAGPRMVPREVELPQSLAQANPQNSRDLFFRRQDKSAVISSPQPLAGPVVYEFRLAHR